MRFTRVALLVAVLGVLLPSITSAGFYDGYRLNEMWSGYKWYMHSTTAEKTELNRIDVDDFNKKSNDCSVFMGYVVGVSDATGTAIFQIPDGAKIGQLCAVVGQYLEKHPEKWNEEAWIIVIEALREAFPPKPKK